MRRNATLLLFPIMLACRADRTETVTNDSAHIDTLRTLADSIARDMALAIAATGSRSGSWTSTESAERSEWTAHMQGEHVSVIEERVDLGDAGTAVRGFFFAHTGALEQISEQRRERPVPGGTPRAIETRIDFSGTAPVARRTVDGAASTVSETEIEAMQRHAAELVNAARHSAPDTTKR